MIKNGTRQAKAYLSRLIPYSEVSQLVVKLQKEHNLNTDFSWVDEQQEPLKKEILEAIDQVTNQKTRKILTYKFIDGLTAKEISIELQISESLCYASISEAYREITLPIISA